MAKIHVLDPHLANMIAAGEVVERPANIVKECVENALDAGAKSIRIEASQGGIDKLVIQDDGCGMDREDAAMAFVRHATSKIKDEDELFRIVTMGFRGEALPSIAAVAHVVLSTSDGQEGTRLEYDYGALVSQESMSFPRGTRIEVTGLFIQTPARFKHLRKPAYEFSIISDLVAKMALSHPDVRFSLFHNGSPVFLASGQGDRKEILFQMYGRETAENACEVFEENEDFRMDGYLVSPKINRANKYFMHFFINGRLVRSRQLSNTLADATAPYMPPGRYPIAVLNIQADPQLVDVNVHPNKWEVRIAKQGQLLDLVKRAAAKAYDAQMETVEIKREPEKKPEINYPWKTAVHESVPEYKPNVQEIMPEEAPKPIPPKPSQTPLFECVEETIEIKDTAPIEEAPIIGRAQLDLKIIGQLKESYILCESTEGLVIIDQHAAQERVRYEQLQDRLMGNPGPLQPLMVPIAFHASPSLLSRISELNARTETFGIQFEPFGRDQIIVRQVPLWFQDVNQKAVLQDVADAFAANPHADLETVRKHMIATMACHSAIRFNRPLTFGEMEQVVKNLQACRQPWHCPHGRPTLIKFPESQLRKEFERG